LITIDEELLDFVKLKSFLILPDNSLNCVGAPTANITAGTFFATTAPTASVV